MDFVTAWFNPDSWMDVVDHLLLILGAIALTATPTILTFRSHNAIKAVRNQVVNGHKNTPTLRADVDRIVAAVDHVVRSVDWLTKEVGDEGQRRRAGIQELHESVERVRRESRDGISELRADIDTKLETMSSRIPKKRSAS